MALVKNHILVTGTPDPRRWR